MSARWYSEAVPFLAGVALISLFSLLLLLLVNELVGVSLISVVVVVAVNFGLCRLDESSSIADTGLSSLLLLYLLIGYN